MDIRRFALDSGGSLTRMDWYDEQGVRRAIRWVADNCVTRADGVVHYEEMLLGIGLPAVSEVSPEGVSTFMGDFHRHQGAVPFDSVVVGKISNWPGNGYWRSNGLVDPRRQLDHPDAFEAMQFWKAQHLQVWRHVGHPLGDAT